MITRIKRLPSTIRPYCRRSDNKRSVFNLSVFLLALIFLPFLQIETAHGWASSYEPTQPCEELGAYFNVAGDSEEVITSFEQFIDSNFAPQFGTRPIASDGFDPSNPEHSLLLYGAIGASGTVEQFGVFYEMDPASNLIFTDNSLDSPTTSLSLLAQTDAVEDVLTYTIVNNGTNATNFFPRIYESQVACVQKAINVDYAASYTGTVFTNVFDEHGALTECDTFDIACQVSNAFTGIADTFLAVGEAITTTIGSLFLPDPDSVIAAQTEISDAVTEQFGAASYSVEWFTGIFTDLQSASACSGDCTVAYSGTFFGQQLEIDYLAMQTTIPLVWNFAVLVIRAGTAYFLLSAWSGLFQRIFFHSVPKGDAA